MIGRLLAFVLGVGLGVLGVLKLRSLLRRATPEAVATRMGEQVAETRSSWSQRLAEMGQTYRSAAAEREAELREALAMDDDTDAAADLGDAASETSKARRVRNP